MIKKIFNQCNLYTLLWCIFHLKAWLYQSNVVSVILYGIVMIMSAYYMFKVLSVDGKNSVVRSYTLLLAMFTVYGVINILVCEPVNKMGHVFPTDFYLQNIVRSMIPFYAFYYFTLKGYITKKWLCYISLLFLVVCIPRFYVAESQMMALLMTPGKKVDEVTNNAGYLFCALIPLFCFWNKKPMLQYIGFGICTFYVLSGMKRGAIIITGINLVYYFYFSLKEGSNRRRCITLLLIAALFAFAYYFFQEMLQTSNYFTKRYELTMEGNTSNRDTLYLSFIKMFWNESSLFYLIFGFGADATIRYGENYAHNDWLEITMNQGLLGLSIFFVFWKQLYSFWKTTKTYPILYIATGVCLTQMFLKTFFSMSINDMQIYTTCVLGYSVAIMSLSSEREFAELLD